MTRVSKSFYPCICWLDFGRNLEDCAKKNLKSIPTELSIDFLQQNIFQWIIPIPGFCCGTWRSWHLVRYTISTFCRIDLPISLVIASRMPWFVHTHTHTTGPMLGTHSHHILQALASQSNQSCYYNHYEYPKWANNGDNNAAKSMTCPLVFLCQCVTRRCPYLPYESSGHGSTVILMGNINVNLWTTAPSNHDMQRLWHYYLHLVWKTCWCILYHRRISDMATLGAWSKKEPSYNHDVITSLEQTDRFSNIYN
jgi:hypothetical protein